MPNLNQTNIYKAIMLVIATITIIYNSGFVMITVNTTFGIMLLFLSIMLMALYILSNMNANKKYRNNVGVFISFCLIFTFSWLNNPSVSNLLSYLRPFLLLLFTFMFTNLVIFDEFVSVYNKIMSVITIISISIHIMISYFNLNYSILPIVQNNNGVEYYNGFVVYIMRSIGDFSRNIGIFWEPGIFASFLIIAIIFELIIKEKPSKVNIIIYSLGVLSTSSSAGYILLIIVSGLLLLRNNTKGSYIFALLIAGISILLYINIDSIIDIMLKINHDVFIKIFNENDSGNTRLISPWVNLSIFRESPILGVGFEKANKLYYSRMMFYGVEAQTSTSTFFMAALGVGGIYYTLLWIIGIFSLKKHAITTKVIITSIIIIIINKEPHYNMLAMYCIMFYLNDKESNKLFLGKTC